MKRKAIDAIDGRLTSRKKPKTGASTGAAPEPQDARQVLMFAELKAMGFDVVPDIVVNGKDTFEDLFKVWR